jgi:hypothetical protein
MSGQGWLVVLGSTAIVLGAGWALGGTMGAVIGSLVGLGLGLIAARLQMRVMVALALVGSLAIGAIIGQGIVHALCLPAGCIAAESFAAVVTGIAALVAVGLVVALVTRSFEEYHEAVAARRPPPEPGCESDELGSDAP